MESQNSQELSHFFTHVPAEIRVLIYEAIYTSWGWEERLFITPITNLLVMPTSNLLANNSQSIFLNPIDELTLLQSLPEVSDYPAIVLVQEGLQAVSISRGKRGKQRHRQRDIRTCTRTAFLRTCHKMYTEAISLLYSTHTFQFWTLRHALIFLYLLDSGRSQSHLNPGRYIRNIHIRVPLNVHKWRWPDDWEPLCKSLSVMNSLRGVRFCFYYEPGVYAQCDMTIMGFIFQTHRAQSNNGETGGFVVELPKSTYNPNELEDMSNPPTFSAFMPEILMRERPDAFFFSFERRGENREDRANETTNMEVRNGGLRRVTFGRYRWWVKLLSPFWFPLWYLYKLGEHIYTVVVERYL